MTHTVTHGLGSHDVLVTCYDELGNHLPLGVDVLNLDCVEVAGDPASVIVIDGTREHGRYVWRNPNPPPPDDAPSAVYVPPPAKPDRSLRARWRAWRRVMHVGPGGEPGTTQTTFCGATRTLMPPNAPTPRRACPDCLVALTAEASLLTDLLNDATSRLADVAGTLDRPGPLLDEARTSLLKADR